MDKITMAEEKKTTLGDLSYNGTEVIRQGESTIPAFEKICWKCGTKFLYISEAIKHDRDGDYAVCPTCGAFIAHQENPKIADFIPPKCTPDAKCEDRSQKHSDFPTTLEEAANAHLDNIFGKGKHEDFYVQLFIAGAEWQKQQILKDAVEGKIYGYDDGSFELIVSWLDLPKDSKFKDGDKVKIVIVKED